MREISTSSQALLNLVIPFVFLFVSSRTQTCPTIGVEAGVEPLNRSLDAASGQNYVMRGKGQINCNGVIREWVFHTNDDCNSSSANIVFEVWKPSSTGPSNYRLIGTNTFSSAYCNSPTDNFVTFGVAPADRIPVVPGFVIGWYQYPNALRISYDIVSDTQSFCGFAGIVPPSIGSTGNLPNITGLQDYSLKVTVIQADLPTIDNLPASVYVKEDVALNTLVFTAVKYLAPNVPSYTTAIGISFQLSPNSVPFFLTNGTNGNGKVETNAALNYEAMNTYQLSITVTVLGLSTTEILTVNVIDVNEPFNITNLPSTIDVSAASTSADDQMFLVTTSDPDVNPAFPVKFFLQSWTSANTNKDIPPFFIDPNTGSVSASVSLGNWYLQHPLNSPPYPSSISYSITILATDGVYNDSKSFTINILAVKQPPVFLNLPSAIQIDENIPGNTVIYQVLVAMTTDPILQFQLMTSATPSPFCIDDLSGIISLCGYAKLNYCNALQYNVSVTATNSVLSSTSLLIVTLRKINNSPYFSPIAYSGSVNEKCPSATTGNCLPPVSVMSISVTDPDLSCPPYPESLTCSVISGSGSQFFDIFNCMTVRNIAPIDVDSFPFYENISLLIEAQDANNLTTFATIHVSVININDHSPIFTQPTYNGSVQENANGGTPILSVTATDGDYGINGEFYYSISPSNPLFLYFQIDPQSGLISTKQPLDYDNPLMPSPLTLTVYATDKGSPPRTGSTIVTVYIIDVNDVRPVIDCSNRPSDEPYPYQPCFYNYDLKYDALLNSNVSNLLLSADDVDPQPCVISFRELVPENHFSMNPINGLVTVVKTVDAYTEYILYVYAEDNGSPTLKSRIMYIRIDTYRPHRHWIDITVRPKTLPFDEGAFLAALRNVTYPWFMKIVSITNYDPKVQTDIVVTVYALADDSTYFPENIVNEKVFVPRGDLLKKLSKNIYGDPAEILRDPPLKDNWTVVKVTPSYVNWWLDTVEGIATIVCLSAIAAILVTAVAVAFLKWKQALCFKPTPPQPMTTGQGGTGASKPSPSNSSNQDNVRYRSAHGRRDSVLTVHSAIHEESL